MESTGTYWQHLFITLQAAGFQVILCNGKFTKNIKGKKSDVKDANGFKNFIQSGYYPEVFYPMNPLNTCAPIAGIELICYDTAADTTRKMQKYLRLLNLSLDVVVNDIAGLTGLAIIDAICKGQTIPEKLADLRHGNCKNSKQEIAKALQSNGRKAYLFALKQEYQLYLKFQEKMKVCDVAIEKLFNE